MSEIAPSRFSFYKSKDGNKIYILVEGMIFLTFDLLEEDKFRIEISNDNECLETELILKDMERLSDEEFIVLCQDEKYKKISEILTSEIEMLQNRIRKIEQINNSDNENNAPFGTHPFDTTSIPYDNTSEVKSWSNQNAVNPNAEISLDELTSSDENQP
jgi:hypothetical protein